MAKFVYSNECVHIQNIIITVNPDLAWGLGKGDICSKSGFVVNRGFAVNLGFTV